MHCLLFISKLTRISRLDRSYTTVSQKTGEKKRMCFTEWVWIAEAQIPTPIPSSSPSPKSRQWTCDTSGVGCPWTAGDISARLPLFHKK